MGMIPDPLKKWTPIEWAAVAISMVGLVLMAASFTYYFFGR
jgi:hypothetical protein